MKTRAAASPTTACAVNNLITYAHVGDVESSLAFYASLGFEPERVLRDKQGRAFWGLAKSGKAEIMFALASGPIDAGRQAVLFYMYSEDVGALRKHLLAHDLHDGGAFDGRPGPNGGRRVVFEATRPHYMTAGEIRVCDPDGYVILVGQLG